MRITNSYFEMKHWIQKSTIMNRHRKSFTVREKLPQWRPTEISKV